MTEMAQSKFCERKWAFYELILLIKQTWKDELVQLVCLVHVSALRNNFHLIYTLPNFLFIEPIISKACFWINRMKLVYTETRKINNQVPSSRQLSNVIANENDSIYWGYDCKLESFSKRQLWQKLECSSRLRMKRALIMYCSFLYVTTMNYVLMCLLSTRTWKSE